MTISKAHQNFSDRLLKPEALTNPENFLGPNYETVLNFWTFMDSLTEDQWTEVTGRYRALDPAARIAAWYAAWYAARSAARDAAGISRSSRQRIAIGDAARSAAWDAAGDAAWYAAGDAAWAATYELIGMHTLLDQGKELLFVPLFHNL